MRRRTSRASRTTSYPRTRASPSLGRRSMISILIVVVLPAPLGPSSPNNSPRLTAKEIPRTASISSRLRRSTPVLMRIRSSAEVPRLDNDVVSRYRRPSGDSASGSRLSGVSRTHRGRDPCLAAANPCRAIRGITSRPSNTKWSRHEISGSDGSCSTRHRGGSDGSRSERCVVTRDAARQCRDAEGRSRRPRDS